MAPRREWAWLILTRRLRWQLSFRPFSVSGLYSLMDDGPELVRIPGVLPPATPVPQSYDKLRGTGTPLIIDNGSTTLRFGFATSLDPVSATNIVAKFRERKQNKPLLLFGDAIDTESGARSQARTAWEGDVLLNFDALVSVFTARTSPVLQCLGCQVTAK